MHQALDQDQSGRESNGWRSAWIYGEIGRVFGLGGGLLLALWWAHAQGWAWWVTAFLGAGVVVVTSTRTFPRAIGALREFELDVDVLMFVAAGGAAVLGHYVEGGFLLWLFGLGAAGEHLALGRAKRAIDALAQVAPDMATKLLEDGNTIEVEAASLEVGDHVVITPFDRVAVDGVIIEGESAFDQATLTGESVPVGKGEGDTVYAGTLNTTHRVVIRVTKAVSETQLSRLIELVQEAQASQSPVQRFTEKVERVYVPCVLGVTLLICVLPPWLTGMAWGEWFYRGMAFLTAASPCALAIGTPSAVLCGVARAARLGVLVKGGGYMQSLARVQTLCFDKTGTLTRGQVGVVAMCEADGVSREDVLRWAAAVEDEVHHPLADAIVRYAEAEGVSFRALQVEDVEQVAGRGARGDVNGQIVEVGKPSVLFEKGDVWARDAVGRWRELGHMVVAVRRGEEVVGVLALADEVRPEAREVLERLREMGIQRQVMLTGDHQAAAHAIASSVGLSDVKAELLPEDKLSAIEALRAEAGPVAMIGDGVNDAPALAAADLGVTLGGVGSDVAVETADVVLMGETLNTLPRAIELARASQRIIRQNLWIALGVILVVAPLGALGLAHLGLVVLLHEGSTIVVVLNALRLLRVGKG